MQESGRKVFIISLDGATFDVLDPLMKLGYLNNLRALRDQGTAVNLASIIPAMTPAAWTSFMTGKHPGKHGIFGFRQFDEQEYNWKLNSSRHVRTKTIWQILSEKGKRVIALNVPQTYPPYEVNGIMVSGWESASANVTYPSSFGQQILDKFPTYDAAL